jgi:hypothetical protein
MKIISIAIAICYIFLANAHAETPKEIQAKVVKVIGKVGEIWTKDGRYETFHRELSEKYQGTPDLVSFMNDEQWVAVISSNSLYFPGVYKCRSPSSMNLKLGDIVEVKISDSKVVKNYMDLSEVFVVLCKIDSDDYSTCAQDNPLNWYTNNNLKLTQPQ